VSTKENKPKPAPLIPILLATAKWAANYKVDASLIVETLYAEKKRTETRDVRAVVDTGAAPVIVRLGALPEGVDIFPLTEALIQQQHQRRVLVYLLRQGCREIVANPAQESLDPSVSRLNKITTDNSIATDALSEILKQLQQVQTTTNTSLEKLSKTIEHQEITLLEEIGKTKTRLDVRTI
jgi:hypothetical protein